MAEWLKRIINWILKLVVPSDGCRFIMQIGILDLTRINPLGIIIIIFLVRLPAPEGFIHVTCSVTFRCPSICVPFPLQSEAIDCCIVADVAPRPEGGDGRAIYYRPRRTNHSMIDVVIISMTSIMMPLADMKGFFFSFFLFPFCVCYLFK